MEMNNTNNEAAKNYVASGPYSKIMGVKVFPTIDENFNFLLSNLGNNSNLIEGKYDILGNSTKAGIAYINDISDKKYIGSMIIKPLLNETIDTEKEHNDILTIIQSKLICAPDIKKSSNMEDIVKGLLSGNTVLFVNNIKDAVIIGTRKIEKRAIEKPENEVTIFASMESYTEDFYTNCSMIMKRLPTPALRFEDFYVGTLSNSHVRLMWIEGIANEKVISEVRQRIQKVNIDYVEGVGVLAELIEESPLSLLPKYRQTQRPDTTAKNLAEGHFAILCDNSPFALIAPVALWDNFKSMDDYTERPVIASFLRLTRYISFILAVTVSPLYLSFVTYNHSIVPPALAVNIANGRAGVPFPSVLELLIMTLAITIIREASLRIPGSVGYFVGTLAAIIIGQAAVTAGYVSASLIIVVAISAIASFAISSTMLVYPARMLNYFFIILSSLFGMFGLINGVVIVVWHLVSLESFGVPYLYPLVPFDLNGIKDTFIRAPFTGLKNRLRILSPFNRNRMPDKKKQNNE
jgi:spore germination protein KA